MCIRDSAVPAATAGLAVLLYPFAVNLIDGGREHWFTLFSPDVYKRQVRDGAGFTVCPVQATPEELAEFGRKVGELLLPLMENPPGGERRAHTIATIVTPPQES